MHYPFVLSTAAFEHLFKWLLKLERLRIIALTFPNASREETSISTSYVATWTLNMELPCLHFFSFQVITLP